MIETDSLLKTTAFDYPLPAERIAQHPLEPRDASRLLWVGEDGRLQDRIFREIPDLLRPGDLLVANRTRVRAARLHGRRQSGGEVELLVLSAVDTQHFVCLVRPARKLRPGTEVEFAGGLHAVIGKAAAGHAGARLVRFTATDAIADVIQRIGSAPLPPYIRAPLANPERYQTVYAQGEAESAAAPTAGLHFTDAVLRQLRERGIGWTTVDLTVGLGTFAPITSEVIAEHRMHQEVFEVGAEAAAAINETRNQGGRVVAVGTTVVRTLESAGGQNEIAPISGSTELFIRPGYRFAVVDGLLTNFHQPRSSLLVLLAAFMGIDQWRQVYAHALQHNYRFLSFGDCMFSWRSQ